jgi:hypothetical protein
MLLEVLRGIEAVFRSSSKASATGVDPLGRWAVSKALSGLTATLSLSSAINVIDDAPCSSMY